MKKLPLALGTGVLGLSLALVGCAEATALSEEPVDAGLFAATEAGLQVSTDDGEAFRPVENAPVLYAVEARADGTLAGVGTDGAIWT